MFNTWCTTAAGNVTSFFFLRTAKITNRQKFDHCFFYNLLRSFIEGGGCDPGNPGGPIGGWVGGPKGSEPPMPPEEACCKRSTMELAAVLSAGEIGAKKWLESRADMAEGITMLGSLAVISVEELQQLDFTSKCSD